MATHLQAFSHSLQHPHWKILMSNPKKAGEDDDDSWEVRAFAEDAGNLMAITWPPRSYTCTFCQREFRSAQALGGHMNVHRRDRAQLRHRTGPNSANSISNPNGRFFFFYQISNPNGGDPSVPSQLSMKSAAEERGASSSSSHSSQISSRGDESFISIDDGSEKLDLELRLGHRPSSS